MMKFIGVSMTIVLLFSCSKTESWEQELTQDITILALGDSLTAGYGLDVSESYPSKLGILLGENYTIINAGISGDTSAQALARVQKYNNPDIVILVIGGNDGLRNQSVTEMKENINEIIDYYISQGSQVVLGGVELPALYGLEYSREFKQAYFDIANERGDEIYFYESFLADVGGVSKYNQSDRIHPTSKGYDIITQNLYKYLQDEKLIR